MKQKPQANSSQKTPAINEWLTGIMSKVKSGDIVTKITQKAVEIMGKRPHLSVLDWGPGERARLREQIERRGMRRVCVAAYTNFTADLEHAEIPQREFQIHYVTALAEFARDLGGDLVRVFTGYENPAAEYGRQWKLVVETLRECARRAAEFGVTIGVQNHHAAWRGPGGGGAQDGAADGADDRGELPVAPALPLRPGDRQFHRAEAGAERGAGGRGIHRLRGVSGSAVSGRVPR